MSISVSDKISMQKYFFSHIFCECFLRQMRQIHGCSAAAVNTFMDAFGPTGPFHGFSRTHAGIIEALQSRDSVSIKRSIADLVKVEDGMRLGPKLADMIYTIFTK